MKYLNALNKISGVGSQKIRLLLNQFASPENIWKANLTALKNAPISEKLAEKIVFARKQINPIEEWDKLQKESINIIALSDKNYPTLLKEIHNPPYILYQRGKFSFNQSPMLAIVGARKYTPYGSQVAFKIAKELAKLGIIIVSGMALGIDAFAHQGAIQGEGKTLAILGNSLDDRNIYPRYNFNLSREIIQNGALLSEYPLETPAGRMTFPARNRIVAGLTLGTLVIEAGEKSGTLITAQMALEYNREVLAVPGSILSPESKGTNNLIKNGAKVVTGLKDILEEINFSFIPSPVTPTQKPANLEEEKIMKILSSTPIHIDNIAKLVKLQTAIVASNLAMLEIKGWIKNIGGQNYIQL